MNLFYIKKMITLKQKETFVPSKKKETFIFLSCQICRKTSPKKKKTSNSFCGFKESGPSGTPIVGPFGPVVRFEPLHNS